jgi:hypothetical protein
MNATLVSKARSGFVAALTFAPYMGTWGKVSQWCNRLPGILWFRGRFSYWGKGKQSLTRGWGSVTLGMEIASKSALSG